MGVHVDPARRDHQASGVDLALAGAKLAADRGDAAAGNRHVARERRLAGAVDDGAAANDDVVHGMSLPDGGCESRLGYGIWPMMHPAAGPCNGLFCSTDETPTGAESSFNCTANRSAERI